MEHDTPEILKILFVTPYQPDLIRVRPYQLIRHLAKAGHQVSLVYYDSPAHTNPEPALNEFCNDVYAFPLKRESALYNSLRALPTRQPIQYAYGLQREMEQKLQSLVNEDDMVFDIIHFEHIRTAIYASRLLQKNPHIARKCVWDSVDSITLLFRQAARQHPRWVIRQFMKIEANRTAYFEGKAPGLFKQVLVTSQKDKDSFSDLQKIPQSNLNISVLPNGVDLEYFKPGNEIQRSTDTLVISGKMSYHANESMVHHFISTILPLIWEKRPDVKLVIVGQNPSSKIRAYASDPRIRVTGWVDDIRPFLQTAAVAVAPLLYGAGIQNKILEAMACETPVIASPIAVQALQAEVGKEIMVGNDDNDFTLKVLELLSNSQLAASIGCAGRDYVERKHSWSATAGQLSAIYRKIMAETI